MGNNQQSKKVYSINKTQFQVACTKAKIHLQMMRDRKNAQIIKGQKQLVNKLNSHNRNKVQEILLAERVTNGLKYAQSCNLLASYAASLKSQANYISQNVQNIQKIKPWLIYIYSLQFAAQHMGISSLEEYKKVIRTLSNPQGMQQHCNKQIIQLLNPTPTSQQINIYMYQMSQRNLIPLQQINMIGHKFTKQWNSIPVELDQHILNTRKSFVKSDNQGNYPENQGNMGSSKHSFGEHKQNVYGYNENQVQNNIKPVNYENANPYKGVSSINNAPTYYMPPDIISQNKQKPRQFSSFQQMLKANQQNNFKLPIYPQVNPKQYVPTQYKPIHNPFTPPQSQNDHNSPSLSQIMKDFQKKQ